MSARGHATRTHDRITESIAQSKAERTGSPAMTGAWVRARPLLASGQDVEPMTTVGQRLFTACQSGVPD